MKKFTSSLTILSILTLMGCGGSGSGSSSSSHGGIAPDGTEQDIYKIQKVAYALHGSALPSCSNPHNITTSKALTDDSIGLHDCTWICGDYEGEKPISVTFSFIQDGKDAPWELYDILTSSAPEGCHN